MPEADISKARRPLKVRDSSWAKAIAHFLTQRNISPDNISLASIVFAMAAALLLILPRLLDFSPSWGFSICYLLAAVAIQGRLLCNLFDGMVAVEGGKISAAGELYNDIPDRIADPLIFIALGYSLVIEPWTGLGWLAALLAVMTAYIRTLAASMGAPMNYCGPMAKQHRMALMTSACVICAIEMPLLHSQYSFKIALLITVIGCVITLYRRTHAAFKFKQV